MTDSIKIPTANLGFTTSTFDNGNLEKCLQVIACDDDLKPEMAILAQKHFHIR